MRAERAWTFARALYRSVRRQGARAPGKPAVVPVSFLEDSSVVFTLIFPKSEIRAHTLLQRHRLEDPIVLERNLDMRASRAATSQVLSWLDALGAALLLAGGLFLSTRERRAQLQYGRYVRC